MRKLFTGMFVAALAVTSGACAYGGIASHGDKIYIARNSALFGLMRKVYECTPDGAGNMTCVAAEGRP